MHAGTASRHRAHRRSADQQGAPPAPVVPFVAAAHEHTEQFLDVTVTPGAGITNIGPINVPAYGFIRHIYLEVIASGGALGAGVLSADYPWNFFQLVTLNDVNGAPIYGPLDGYAGLWSNILGGYAFQQDPRRAPWYVSTINAQFPFRVPVEISHHDGFGSLANQNAAASYQLNLVVNPSSVLYSTAPTTVPSFRVRGYLEAWSLPNDTDVIGRPQAQFPPVHGTTQFWSQNIRTVGSGQITVPVSRVGNLIRAMAFITRNAAGARTAGVFPDPAQLAWDARSLLFDTQNYRNAVAYERFTNLATTAIDAGVFLYAFNHSTDNGVGDDTPALWLPTVQSTRLELNGVNTTAGNIQTLINDVAPAEVIPAERFVETSATGFRPQVGVSNPSIQ